MAKIKVYCPACESKATPHKGRQYYCHRCGSAFVPGEVEGGTYDTRDPSKRLMQQESGADSAGYAVRRTRHLKGGTE